MTQTATEDPRVIASRERLLSIPWWRPLKMWRMARKHVDTVNAVIAENIAREHER